MSLSDKLIKQREHQSESIARLKKQTDEVISQSHKPIDEKFAPSASSIHVPVQVQHKPQAPKVAPVVDNKKRVKIDYEEEDDGDSNIIISKKIKKDPSVKADFLPDAEREKAEAELEQKLEQEWKELNEKLKKEKIEIVFSYYDGASHRKKLLIPREYTVLKFIDEAKKLLTADFPSLAFSSSSNFMFVKEDTILPHNATFHELILSKAYGKTGPLFDFGVRETIRSGGLNDSSTTVARDAVHPGKIVSSKWYAQNRHIYPASNWEPL
jgi:protein FAM50